MILVLRTFSLFKKQERQPSEHYCCDRYSSSNLKQPQATEQLQPSSPFITTTSSTPTEPPTYTGFEDFCALSGLSDGCPRGLHQPHLDTFYLKGLHGPTYNIAFEAIIKHESNYMRDKDLNAPSGSKPTATSGLDKESIVEQNCPRAHNIRI